MQMVSSRSGVEQGELLEAWIVPLLSQLKSEVGAWAAQEAKASYALLQCPLPSKPLAATALQVVWQFAGAQLKLEIAEQYAVQVVAAAGSPVPGPSSAQVFNACFWLSQPFTCTLPFEQLKLESANPSMQV